MAHTDAISCWLDHAGRFALLSNEEVIHLSRTIQSSDTAPAVRERAINTLITSNLRLVANVWRKQFAYVKAKEPRAADLLQEGAIGLRRAAEKFDYTRGYTFSTYAINWIRKEMSAFLRDRDRNIRISADCFAVVNTARKFVSVEESRTGVRPSIKDIAAKAKRPESTVTFFLERYMTTSNSSLNRQVLAHDGTAGQVLDIVEGRPEYDYDMDARGEKLGRILEIIMDAAGLNQLERDLVIGRNCYGENPRPFSSIAEEHGFKPSWGRTHYLRVMKRLSTAAQSSGMSMTRILEEV